MRRRPTSIYTSSMAASIGIEKKWRVTSSNSPHTPQPKPDLIFGADYKMQYIDPYLFYAYELRRYSLEAKIILTIGYSFRDEHINGIITQALQHDKSRVLVAVSKSATSAIKQLGGTGEQYKAHDQCAAAFLSEYQHQTTRRTRWLTARRNAFHRNVSLGARKYVDERGDLF